jgi:hypothetical protein
MSNDAGEPASRIPVIAIKHASARPSSLTGANSAALPGHLRIASDLASSFAHSLPGGMPTRRFHAAGAMVAVIERAARRPL